ncbi:MAG: hypothetical protein GZ091_06935 [Paludibacter sp.]|nr:hypothetical protein [Paludibacter sp.]
MINRELTDLYLDYFDSLSEAMYLCWRNSFCFNTKTLDKVKLKEQIKSHGLYNHKNATKKDSSHKYKSKLHLNSLLWANKYIQAVNENSLCEYVELYEQAFKEIEANLFILKNKTERVAYANIILRDLDKNGIHNQCVVDYESYINYKEIFKYILDVKFIAEENIITTDRESCWNQLNYELTVRLINHFNFIDSLIELFCYFEINIVLLAEKTKYELYLFCESKYEICVNNNFEQVLVPKFSSTLSDECLIKIMQYLANKDKLVNPNSDVWLFWFNRKTLKNPGTLKWKGSPTMLSNIIQHVCGECISETIKTAFCTKKFVKQTKKEYEASKIYKELEQIITISQQKNS